MKENCLNIVCVRGYGVEWRCIAAGALVFVFLVTRHLTVLHYPTFQIFTRSSVSVLLKYFSQDVISSEITLVNLEALISYLLSFTGDAYNDVKFTKSFNF